MLGVSFVRHGSLAAEAGPFAYVTNASLGTTTKIAITDASVVATIPVSLVNNPVSIKMSPDGTRLYVKNENGISVVDAASKRVVHTIVPPNCDATECFVGAIDPTPDGALLYVTTLGLAPDLGFNAVVVIDTRTYQVVASIPVGPRPDAIAVSSTGFAYVVLGSSYAVAVIDAKTHTVTKTIRLSHPPVAVAVTHDGRFAYVGQEGYPSSVVDVVDTSTNAVIAELPLTGNANGIAITPNDAAVYVTGPSGASEGPSGTVTVIDISTNMIRATLKADAAGQLAIASDGAFVYVSGSSGGAPNVLVIDTATNAIVDYIPVNPVPLGIAVAPSGRAVYVANPPMGVSVIDTATRKVASVIPSDTLGGVVVRPDGRFAYVTVVGQYPGGTAVAVVIDTTTDSIVTRIPFAQGAGPMAVSPNGRLVYVGSNPVAVVDTVTNTVTMHVPLPTDAPIQAMGFSPDGTQAYAITAGTFDLSGTECTAGHLWTIDTARATASAGAILPGGLPTSLAVTPDGRSVYVTILARERPQPEHDPCHLPGFPPPPWCQCPVFSGVMVVDVTAGAVVANIADTFPEAIAIRPDGRFAYITTDGYTVDVIDTTANRVTASVRVFGTGGLAITPDGTSVWALGFTSSVSVIDTATNAFSASVFVGGTPTSVAIAEVRSVPPPACQAPSFSERGGCSLTPTTRAHGFFTFLVLLPPLVPLSWRYRPGRRSRRASPRPLSTKWTALRAG